MSRTIKAIFWDPCTDTTGLVEEQLKDQLPQKLLRDNSTLAKVRVPSSNLDIVCTGKIRPFVHE